MKKDTTPTYVYVKHSRIGVIIATLINWMIYASMLHVATDCPIKSCYLLCIIPTILTFQFLWNDTERKEIKD